MKFYDNSMNIFKLYENLWKSLSLQKYYKSAMQILWNSMNNFKFHEILWKSLKSLKNITNQLKNSPQRRLRWREINFKARALIELEFLSEIPLSLNRDGLVTTKNKNKNEKREKSDKQKVSKNFN